MVLPELPKSLDAVLNGPLRGPLRATLRQTLRDGLRVHAARVSELPLSTGLMGKLLGQRTAEPVLPVTASKVGGRPYIEGDWPVVGGKPCHFVGQLNFDELGCDVEGIPQRGLFALFAAPHAMDTAPFAWRWYPWPDAHRVNVDPGPSLARFECRLTAEPRPSVAYGAAFDAEWAVARERLPEDQQAMAERISAGVLRWIRAEGANVCAWLPGALSGPGRRAWMREPARNTNETEWLQLWTPLACEKAEFGVDETRLSLMIEASALADQSFDGVDVLRW